MRIKSKLTGHAELDKSLTQLRLRGRRDVADIIEEKAERIVEIATEEIMFGMKSGKVYNGHQASAPGEFPANFSGELVASFYIDGSGSNQYQSVRTVGNSAPHAPTLEFGGFSNPITYVAPRPFLAPSADMVESEILSDLENVFSGGFDI